MSFPEAKAAMARAYSSGKTPKLLSVSPSGNDELWAVDQVVFVVPAVPADAPPVLEYALRLRREATLVGECDQCGASFTAAPVEDIGDAVLSGGVFAHRGNCPAADENIAPLMEKYHRSHKNVRLQDQLQSAKNKTKEKAVANIPNRINIDMTDEVKAKANNLLDKRLATAAIKACGHLKANPVQTWNLFLWDDGWRCDECNFRFLGAVHNGAYRLSGLEEQSCDFCRRYAPTTLAPIVMRIDIYVIHGAMCRRCAKEWNYKEEVEVK
jgi:hypothetical protein